MIGNFFVDDQVGSGLGGAGDSHISQNRRYVGHPAGRELATATHRAPGVCDKIVKTVSPSGCDGQIHPRGDAVMNDEFTFEYSGKRRKGFPSETRVKHRFPGGSL